MSKEPAFWLTLDFYSILYLLFYSVYYLKNIGDTDGTELNCEMLKNVRKTFCYLLKQTIKEEYLRKSADISDFRMKRTWCRSISSISAFPGGSPSGVNIQSVNFVHLEDAALRHISFKAPNLTLIATFVLLSSYSCFIFLLHRIFFFLKP